MSNASFRRFRECVGLTALSVAVCVAAAPPAPTAAQVARGQVVDSVTGNPIPGATLELVDSSGSVHASSRADPNGLFLLRASGPGRFRITVSHSGHQTSSFPPFTLQDLEFRSFMLLVPSDDPTAQALGLFGNACPDESERGNIVGWVRHAGTRVPIPYASIRFSWSEFPAFLRELAASEFSSEAQSDSSGAYKICGVPLRTEVVLQAASDSSSSDFVAVTFLEQAIAMIGESNLPLQHGVARIDLPVIPIGQRTTTLTGFVTDGTDDPVSDAVVEVGGGTYETRTDEDGYFELTNLPAGPTRLIVRRIGSGIVHRELMLPQGGTIEIPRGLLVVGANVELDPVIVEAAPPHDPLSEFNVRRSRGQGSFITREEFMRQGAPATAVDVLRRMQGIRIYPGQDFDRRWIITMQRGGTRTFGFARRPPTEFEGLSPCPPLVFVDRHYIGNVNTVAIDAAVPLQTVEAVEAHQSAATLPYEFNRPGAACGVLAFWTRFAEPRPVPLGGERGAWKPSALHLGIAIAAILGILLTLGKGIHF